jgi:hypothetical protein
MLAEPAVLAQHLIGWDLDFALRLVPQPGPLYLDLAIRQWDAARLCSVMPNIATAYQPSTKLGTPSGGLPAVLRTSFSHRASTRY